MCKDTLLSTDTLGTSKHSQLLSNASITLSDSGIAVDCEFAEGNPQSSCVLVYREYDSPLLTVVELPQLIEFPVSITVSDPENYTFALFGRDSQLGIEEEPVACVKFTLADSGEIPLYCVLHNMTLMPFGPIPNKAKLVYIVKRVFVNTSSLVHKQTMLIHPTHEGL